MGRFLRHGVYLVGDVTVNQSGVQLLIIGGPQLECD